MPGASNRSYPEAEVQEPTSITSAEGQKFPEAGSRERQRSDRCLTDLLDQTLEDRIAHPFDELDAPDNQMAAAAHSPADDLSTEFTHHLRYIHHNTSRSENSKVRAKPERDDRFSRVLPNQSIVNLP